MPDLNVSVIEIKDRAAASSIDFKPDELVNTSVDINDILLTELKETPKPDSSSMITFTLDQVEAMLERVKTKHQAEKRVLAQEIVLLKHVTKMVVKQCKQMKVSFFS